MAKKTSNYLGIIFTITLIALVIYYVWLYNGLSGKTKSLKISVNEAKARRFGLIVDVRTSEEREHLGYYPNSIPIPLDRLSAEVPSDISNTRTHILVYSNGDNRAKKGAEILYNMGYINTRFIQETYLSLMPGSS